MAGGLLYGVMCTQTCAECVHVHMLLKAFGPVMEMNGDDLRVLLSIDFSRALTWHQVEK